MQHIKHGKRLRLQFQIYITLYELSCKQQIVTLHYRINDIRADRGEKKESVQRVLVIGETTKFRIAWNEIEMKCVNYKHERKTRREERKRETKGRMCKHTEQQSKAIFFVCVCSLPTRSIFLVSGATVSKIENRK